jgi:hypothetical protein
LFSVGELVVKLEMALVLGVAIGFGPWALAEEPASPNPRALGTAEAILNTCARLDPKHAAQYHERVVAVSQGASSESVAEVRKRAAYKQAYDAATESIGTASGPAALKACRNSLTDSK